LRRLLVFKAASESVTQNALLTSSSQSASLTSQERSKVTMTQNRKQKSPNTFQGCEESNTSLKKFKIEMHMETNDQSGIPPVTLQRIGYRPLHLYLIFLLVCVHDHSPYQHPDVTILNEASYIIFLVC
jgi:hypothetical protein